MKCYVGSFQFELPKKVIDRYNAPITEESKYRKCAKGYVGGGRGNFKYTWDADRLRNCNCNERLSSKHNILLISLS